MKQNHKEIVSILIPTWNNREYLQGAITSIVRNGTTEGLFHIYVINNGDFRSCDWIQSPYVTVIQTGGKNLGWSGGINLGLKHSKGEFVCFFNDDAYIPVSSRTWLLQMLQHFKDPRVAAVGPASNVVMGFQNIFVDIPYQILSPKFLIGFCVLMRRSYFKEIGNMDEKLPGGDDFDWSIRFRNKGYRLVINRDVFVFHHGFKTGNRVQGDANKPGGWNSYEYTQKVDDALIKKHGFRQWWETKKGAYELPEVGDGMFWEDTEAVEIRKLIKGKKVLDIGCGGNKTIPSAIGIDMIKKDEIVETLKPGTASSADVNADASQPLPFEDGSIDTIIARHIMEHLVDPVEVLNNWKRLLKPNGVMLIAVPNQEINNTIPMNIEHVHAFTPNSMRHLMESVGLQVITQVDPKNGVSFITEAKLK